MIGNFMLIKCSECGKEINDKHYHALIAGVLLH